ncbi:MAG: hypothetical protein U0R51_03055 [Solirubrobacterales bacterium]
MRREGGAADDRTGGHPDDHWPDVDHADDHRAVRTDEELIRATITFLTVPNDPTVCDELITPAFLKQSYGGRRGCVAARKPKALADQATILARKPGPRGSAIVTVKPQGGVFDAQTLKVTVVKNGQAWQIDKITSNAKVGP